MEVQLRQQLQIRDVFPTDMVIVSEYMLDEKVEASGIFRSACRACSLSLLKRGAGGNRKPPAGVVQG